MIGTRVGDYLITELLGEGGMGVVYKGVHEALGQIVAVKMLHPALMTDERVKSRFVREAQALARLNHPNIVRLLNFLNRDDTCFIVMEFIEGKTIEKLLHELGIIPPLLAAEYFVQVLAAMHYAHTLGIIHRDIKPANVSVLTSGQVKLLDFGTAKMVGMNRLTAPNMTLGTLIYMSPEQICGRELDLRSDIYSLGVMLYEMVTGKLPHYSDDEMELVRQIARGTPEPPSVHYKFIPQRLEKIILRAIEKDPGKRYQSADDFLKDLRAFMAEEKAREKKATPPSGVRAVQRIGEPPPGPGAAVGTGVAGGGRANAALATVAALVLIAGVAGGLAMAFAGGMRGAGFGVVGAGVVIGGILGAVAFRGTGALAAGNAAPAAGLAAGAPPAPPPPPSPPVAAAPGMPLAIGEATVSHDPPAGGGRPVVPGSAPPVPALAHVPAMPPQPAAGAAAAPGYGAAYAGHGHALGYGQAGAPAVAGAAPHAAAPPPGAFIYAFEGPDRGRSWPLGTGAITIGRGPHNTVVLSDPGVSTTHAQIGFEGQHFILTDLQSRNGCYVNNQRVTRAPLRDRDVIVVGTTHIAVALQAPVPTA